jgi:O-antigen/teichoic acid export membrane protein
VSTEIANMTPRQVWIGLTKIVIAMTVGLLILAFLVSLIANEKPEIASVTLNALLLAMAISILASGVRSVLGIIDWFETRRSKSHG